MQFPTPQPGVFQGWKQIWCTLRATQPWPHCSVGWGVIPCTRGYRCDSWSGRVQEAKDRCFSLTSVFLSVSLCLSLSLSPSPFFSTIRKHVLRWGLKAIQTFKYLSLGHFQPQLASSSSLLPPLPHNPIFLVHTLGVPSRFSLYFLGGIHLNFPSTLFT